MTAIYAKSEEAERSKRGKKRERFIVITASTAKLMKNSKGKKEKIKEFSSTVLLKSKEKRWKAGTTLSQRNSGARRREIVLPFFVSFIQTTPIPYVSFLAQVYWTCNTLADTPHFSSGGFRVVIE